jgi:hypothetical protein
MKNLKFAFLLFAATTLLTAACKREKATTAKIQVLDEATLIPVGGVTVRVYGEQTDTAAHNDIILDREATTDGSGYASFAFTEDFELGQAGFAVLTVDVTRNGTTYESIAVIKIEEETENELVVKVP